VFVGPIINHLFFINNLPFSSWQCWIIVRMPCYLKMIWTWPHSYGRLLYQVGF
jgi:hypothetical protein